MQKLCRYAQLSQAWCVRGLIERGGTRKPPGSARAKGQARREKAGGQTRGTVGQKEGPIRCRKYTGAVIGEPAHGPQNPRREALRTRKEVEAGSHRPVERSDRHRSHRGRVSSQWRAPGSQHEVFAAASEP